MKTVRTTPHSAHNPTYEYFPPHPSPQSAVLPPTCTVDDLLVLPHPVQLPHISLCYGLDHTQPLSACIPGEPVVSCEDPVILAENAIDTYTKQTSRPGQLPNHSALHPRYLIHFVSLLRGTHR